MKPAGSEAKVAEATAAMQKESAAKQPKLDAIMAKIVKLNEQMVALVQKDDYAAMEPIDAEKTKLQEEYDRIANGSDTVADAARCSDSLPIPSSGEGRGLNDRGGAVRHLAQD